MWDTDLLIAIAGMCCIGLCVFGFGRWIGQRAGAAGGMLLVLGLLISAAFAWFAVERLVWAALIPLSSVILWSNWTPVLVAGAAGIAYANESFTAARRRSIAYALLVVGLLILLQPVLRSVVRPVVGWEATSWQGQDCLQSHPGTCGPASAATLLLARRIPASERQLALWCLTSNEGTSPLGLYRGLSRATEGSAFRAIVTATELDEIANRQQLPAVALIEFESSVEHRSDVLFGNQAQKHVVVLLGRDQQGSWQISDPAVGRVVWDEETLRQRFSGQAIYLRQ